MTDTRRPPTGSWRPQSDKSEAYRRPLQAAAAVDQETLDGAKARLERVGPILWLARQRQRSHWASRANRGSPLHDRFAGANENGKHVGFLTRTEEEEIVMR